MTPNDRSATREHPAQRALTPGVLLSVALAASLSCTLLLLFLARTDRLNAKPAPTPEIVELDDVPMVVEIVDSDDGATSEYRVVCDLRAEADGEDVGTMTAECRT